MQNRTPRFLRKAEKKMKSLQRALSRKKRWSRNSEKARQQFAIQCSRVANLRKDFNQKLSAKLVKVHDLIALEDLKIQNMVKSHYLAKSIVDAGWGQILRFTEYKAKKKGNCAFGSIQPSARKNAVSVVHSIRPLLMFVHLSAEHVIGYWTATRMRRGTC